MTRKKFMELTGIETEEELDNVIKENELDIENLTEEELIDMMSAEPLPYNEEDEAPMSKEEIKRQIMEAQEEYRKKQIEFAEKVIAKTAELIVAGDDIINYDIPNDIKDTEILALSDELASWNISIVAKAVELLGEDYENILHEYVKLYDHRFVTWWNWVRSVIEIGIEIPKGLQEWITGSILSTNEIRSRIIKEYFSEEE